MKFFKLWVPVFGWCWVIFYLSGIPQLGTGWGVWDLILRKAAHITEYFILAVLLYRALKGSINLSSFYLSVWTFSLSFLYAVSDEIHQALHEVMNQKTVLVIAHRLSTLKEMDRILVFVDGKIVEDGNGHKQRKIKIKT